MPHYDAIVVGSGPNGLAAAITLQRAGLGVLVVEGAATLGGGLRSAQLTLPGFTHDVCSAIHPMAVSSPFFQSLPLHEHGLEFIYPPVPAAHPFDDGTAAVLLESVEETAQRLGSDGPAYRRLFTPLTRDWPDLARDLLGPLRFPENPVAFARFGLSALPSAQFGARRFETVQARGLWAGMAAHAIQPLSNLTTSAIALALMTAGHRHGWPLPRGGSQRLADALVAYFRSLGGEIQTEFWVKSLDQLPPARAVLLDVTPRQLLAIAGKNLSWLYRAQLGRYRYGMGVFKVDFALDGPVPWRAPEVRRAGTVHLGGTLQEIAEAEARTATNRHPDKPFVLLAQPSLFDPSRAPAGQHTIWAYCHVPHGSAVDRTEAIERQIERFAPGFRDRILARNAFSPAQLETHNPNYVGGDINGGVQDAGQLFTRPVLRLSPYRTSAKGLFLCSSSTPPGGGVHGMGGYHAARVALRDVFRR